MKPNIVIVPKQNRPYYFANSEVINIKDVIGFADSTTTHRLEDNVGQKWIVPKTFLAIRIETKEGWTL